jgi:hypothetical protein
MPEPVRVALSQLVLWYDATRIQSWPELLARIPADAVFGSATEFGRTYATNRMTDGRHAAAEKITRNLPGLERTKDKYLLRGVGLLQRDAGGYGLSQEGQQLAESYRDDPKSAGWVSSLTRLLLEREPRTRALVRLLSDPDAHLVFEKGWFGGSLRKAALERHGVPPKSPFYEASGECSILREFLNSESWWCLGAWRSHPDLADREVCVFVGQLKEAFSLHDVGLALHAACEVLLHAGVLECHGNECTVNQDVGCRTLGTELAEDFGWADSHERPVGTLEAILELLPTLRSDTGFIVASELREALRRRGIADPDREIADLERGGKVLVYAEDYGQPRHGTGLYNDARKQLIKLRVVGEGVAT